MMQTTGKIYPYAKHVNTVCNDKINNIPQDFNGKFVVEESYYETNGNRHASPHLFLITENEDGILLSSYEIPEGEDKNTFSYDSMKNVDYSELKKSKKFTPALYHENDGIWEGGSTNQFSPVMTFKLWEKFSDSCLEVSEIIEVNGILTMHSVYILQHMAKLDLNVGEKFYKRQSSLWRSFYFRCAFFLYSNGNNPVLFRNNSANRLEVE